MTGGSVAPRSLADLIDEVGGRVACLALSRDPNAKMTILLFPPDRDEPVLVAKVPTTDIAAEGVRRETDRLTEINDRDLGPVHPTVPHVAAITTHQGMPVLVTTAVPGRSMLAAYHAWRHTARPAAVAADFTAASDWLTDLHTVTGSGDINAATGLDGVAAVIRRRYGGRPGVTADLHRLGEVRDRLAQQRTVKTVVHGDFWPGNLMVADGRVCGVVDWEHAHTAGPATRDVARFALTYSLYLDRHTRPGRRVAGHPGLRADAWGAGVTYAIDGSGWYPDLVRGFLATALRRLHVSPACWRDVLLAELAVIAAEADHDEFAWRHLLLFRRLHGQERR